MIKVEDEQGLSSQLEANQNRDVIVLFYSTWCPYCRSFQPVFDNYAEKSTSEVYVKIPLDEDENPLWDKYSLDAVPSVLLFRNSQIAKRLDCERGVGLNEAKFRKWLEKP